MTWFSVWADQTSYLVPRDCSTGSGPKSNVEKTIGALILILPSTMLRNIQRGDTRTVRLFPALNPLESGIL